MHMYACTHKSKYTNCIHVSYGFRESLGALNATCGPQVHMPLTCCRRSSYLKGRCRLSLSFISWFTFLLFLFFFFCLAKRESFKEKWVRILEDPDWKWSKVLKFLIITVDINYELCELLGILVCLLVICCMISDDLISHSTRLWSLFQIISTPMGTQPASDR